MSPPPDGDLPRETMFEDMKRYLRFGQDDLARLRALHPRASPHFARISSEFYERIREHEQAHAVLSGEQQIGRLRHSLVRWLERIFTAERDEAYFAQSMVIGLVHVRVGLPQRFVPTAMAQIRIALERIADEVPDDAVATRASLSKALDLELAILLESYCQSFEERLRRSPRPGADRAEGAEGAYAKAVELAPYLFVGLDPEHRIALFNGAAERTSGWARDEAHGAAFVDMLFGAEQRDEIDAKLRAARARGAVSSFDAPIRTRSGQHRNVRWHLAFADTGGEIATMAIGRDVTDEDAKAERARQMEKLAAVGTLAAGLAHEIRNPLNGAQLHVTFLERGLRRTGAGEEALEAVRVVSDEIKRLSNLVDEFLDFARPKPLDRRSVSVNALCAHAAQMVAHDAAKAGVKLTADLPDSELRAEIDPGKTEQVLLNLLHNAIEALAPGKRGNVVLRARRQPLHLIFEVEDDGPGLPAAHAPVFDAFYTTKASGTGLGLSIVHRIVTDHGGSITYESRPGRTVFRATMPVSAPPPVSRD